MQETDRWCIFYPIVKRLLRADVKEITDLALLDNAREPVRYFFCLTRKSRSECLYYLEHSLSYQESFSKQQSIGRVKLGSQTSGRYLELLQKVHREMLESERMSAQNLLSLHFSLFLLTRSLYRDHAQLEKMRQLGMKAEDEYKLSAMRDYINKLAAARQA